MAKEKTRAYQFEYPYTLLAEASGVYMAGVFEDDEARNMFLVHIQPLVRYCVGRVAMTHGGGVARNIDDIVGFTNVKLLEAWLPSYLPSRQKVERAVKAVSYLVMSIRGYVLDYIKKNYDPRTVPFVDHVRLQPALSQMDKEEFGAIYTRMFDEHVALRPRADLDVRIVDKLMRHLAWEEFKNRDGLPG